MTSNSGRGQDLQASAAAARSRGPLVIAYIVAGLLFALVVGSLFGTLKSSAGQDDWLNGPGGVLILAGWLAISVTLVGAVSRLRQKRIAQADKELAEYRALTRQSDSAAGGQQLSRRQLEHAWYGDHPELNWQHREQGEMLGFQSADEYVSNFLEHDKD